MATTISVDTAGGENITINSDDLQEFTRKSTVILSEIAALDEDFKLLVQEMSDRTKLKKTKVSKYLKQRFDFKTKETQELGELFSTLDSALDG